MVGVRGMGFLGGVGNGKIVYRFGGVATFSVSGYCYSGWLDI